jgi:hypothetical protein
MRNRSTLHNYTKASEDVVDDMCSGTLSKAILQCIMEYTTMPGDTVVTFDAQFGAIYAAADNCGRLVFGGENRPHFQNLAEFLVIKLTGQPTPPPKKSRRKDPPRVSKRRKLLLQAEQDETPPPNGTPLFTRPFFRSRRCV